MNDQYEEDAKVTVWASLGATINTGNYENQKIDFGISGVPADASDEFIQEMVVNTAAPTIHKVVNALAAEMGRRLTEDYGR